MRVYMRECVCERIYMRECVCIIYVCIDLLCVFKFTPVVVCVHVYACCYVSSNNLGPMQVSYRERPRVMAEATHTLTRSGIAVCYH